MKDIFEILLVIRNALLIDKDVLTLEEFCTYAGISKNTAYQLTSTGKIKFYRPFGKLIYFAKEDVIDFLKQNPKTTRQDLNKHAIRRILK